MDDVESKTKHYRLLTNSKLPALTVPEKFAIVTSSPVHGEFLLKHRSASGKGLGNAPAIRMNQAWHWQDEAYQTAPLGCSR